MKKKSTGTIFDVRKKITRTHEMISTSYHEAGHAVYILLCGMKISSASIFENKRNNRIYGVCYYKTPNIKKIQDHNILMRLVDYEIGIKYAGLTSEKYFFKIASGSDKFPIFLRNGSSDDTLSAAALIREYNVAPPGKHRYDFKKKKINSVLNILTKYWDDVTLIAHSLFSHKKLSFSDIKNLLFKKSKNKKFWKEKFKNIYFIFEKNSEIDENDLKSKLDIL